MANFDCVNRKEKLEVTSFYENMTNKY